MKDLYFIFSKQKKQSEQIKSAEKRKYSNKFIAVFSLVVGLLMISTTIAHAQTVLFGYSQVSKIGGQIVASQSGLTVLPGQEIEYIVEFYNEITSGTYSNRQVKIELPYYADFYNASASIGTLLPFNPGDTFIRWNLPSLTSSGASSTVPYGTLTFTVVASQDCYALNASCAKDITVLGSIVISTTNSIAPESDFKYGYRTGVNSSTPTTVNINSSAFAGACVTAGNQYREYIYLENKAGGAVIPLSDINKDFPRGSRFYDTINVATGTLLGTSTEVVTGFPLTAAKRVYFALAANNCWQRFYINVLDTSDLVFCAGEDLSKAVVWASNWDAITPNSGNWYLGGDLVPNPAAKILSLGDNNKILTYRGTFVCNSATTVTSNQLKIIVHDRPTITLFNPNTTYCAGNQLTAKVHVDKNDDTVRYEWKFGGVVFGGNSDTVTYPTALANADNNKWLVVTITNSCGVTKDSVQITVNALPVVSITGNAPLCVKSTLTLTGSPSGTGGTWKSLNTSVATVNPTSGLVTAISPGTATIRYIYTGGTNCTDSADVTVTVNPTPFIKNKAPYAICSGSSFTVAPVDGTNNDTVPANTLYTWTIQSKSSTLVWGDSAATVGKPNISQTLVNHDRTEQIVTYLVTPTTGTGTSACTGPQFTVTVTVQPEPVITNKIDTICSHTAYNLTPAHGVKGDTVPLSPWNTFYTWTISTPNANIIGATAQSAYQTSFSQSALSQLTTTPQIIVYTVTPHMILSGGGNSNDTCPAKSFTVTLTVNPIARTTSSDDYYDTICNGGTASLNPINGVNGTVRPPNTKYSWTIVTSNPNITGFTGGSYQDSIKETLVNTSSTPQTIHYDVISHVITNGDTCSGGIPMPALHMHVTVNPTPRLALKVDTVCSGIAYSRTATSAVASTSFAWTRPAVTGISNATNSASNATISETLINTTPNPINVPYIFTLTANGCTNTDTLMVTVNPKPVLSSLDTIADICSGASVVYTPASLTSDVTYTWTRAMVTGISPSTGTGSGSIGETLTTTNANSTIVTYIYTLTTNKGCTNTDTVRVRVNPSQALTLTSPDTMPTICSGAAATYTATTATSGAVISWVRQAVTGILPVPGAATTSATVGETLRNTTSSPITVTYTFTVAANNCNNNKTVTVVVNPEPIIKNKVDTICSENYFAVTPMNLQNGDTLPSNTLYTWVVSTPNANITGAANQSVPQSNISIAFPSSRLANTSTTPQTVVYTVTPVSGTCTGANFTLSVTVNPAVYTNDMTYYDTICSGGTTSLKLVNGVHGIVPPNTKYSWVDGTSNPNITGFMGGTNQDSIKETLVNTSTSPQTMLFGINIVTTTNGKACALASNSGDIFYYVTVNPTAKLSSAKLDTVCSDVAYTYTATSLTANTTFGWTRAAVTGISNAAGSGTGAGIAETLINTTASPVTVTYIYSLIANGCATGTDTLRVLVNPRPVLSSLDTIADICSGTLASYTGTSAISPLTYSWTRANVSGITPLTGSGATNVIGETLTNSNTTPTLVTYIYTLITQQGCVNTDTVTVRVNPLPQITLGNNAAICVRDTNRLTTTYAGGTWKSLNTAIATVDATTGLVTGTGAGNVTIRYTVTTPNGCTDSADMVVTIKALPVLTIAGSNAICVGTTTQLTSNEAGGTWTSLNTSVATIDASGLVTGIAIGSTRFVYVSSLTGCSDTTGLVTVGSFPSVDPITASKPATCQSGSDSYITFNNATSGGVWSLSNGNATLISQPTVTPATVQGNTVGQVYVTYTVGTGTCQSKATFLLKVVSTTPPQLKIGFER